MRDPELVQYVEAVERHLCARRGVERLLSPVEFALARRWYSAGVPLAEILNAIDGAFDAGQTAFSLSFCRRQVEAHARGDRARRTG